MMLSIPKSHPFPPNSGLVCRYLLVEVAYLHEFSRIDEAALQHLLSETTHRAVKLVRRLTVFDPPGRTRTEEDEQRSDERMETEEEAACRETNMHFEDIHI